MSIHGNVVYHVSQIKRRAEIQTTVWKKRVSSTSCILSSAFVSALHSNRSQIKCSKSCVHISSALHCCFTDVQLSEKLATGWYSERPLCPSVSGACSGRGILQVRAGVRGFARSIAPSRLSPHWARLSDPLPHPYPPRLRQYQTIDTSEMRSLACFFILAFIPDF